MSWCCGDEIARLIVFLFVDLSGDKAEIPSGIQSGHPPTNSDFFFSDLVYDTQA